MKNLLHSEGNRQQNEKARNRIREDMFNDVYMQNI